MPRLVDAQTLEYVDVPDDQAQSAIASGRYGFDPSQSVSVVGLDGQRYDLDAQNAAQALAEGYQLESDTEQRTRLLEEQYGDQDLRAGLEGAARGLTFGLSDQIARGVGVPAEDLAGREEAHPNVAIGSEIAGAALPILLSGGAGAAGTAARTAGAGVRGAAALGGVAERAAAGALKGLAGRGAVSKAVAKAASRGAGGAVEGSLFGAGQVISEDALGRTELTAENLAAGLGMGALIGGVAGGVFGVGEEVVSGALRGTSGLAQKGLARIGVGAGDNLVSDLANDQAYRSLGATRSILEKVARGPRYGGDVTRAAQEIGEFIRRPLDELGGETLMRATRKQTQEQVERALKAAGSKIDDVSKALDDAGFENRLTGNRLAERLKKELLERDDIADLGAFADDFVAPVRKIIEDAESFGDAAIPFRQANRIKQKLQAKAKYDRNTEAAVTEAYRNAASVVRDEVEVVARETSEELGERLAQSNDLFGRIKDVETVIDQGVSRQQGNRLFSLTDNIQSSGALAAGVLSGSLPVGLMTGAAMGAANNFARNRGNALAARVLGRIEQASSKSSRRLSKALDRVTQTADDTANAGLESAAVRGLGDKAQTPRVKKSRVSRRVRRAAVPTSVEALERVSFGDDRIRPKTKLDAYNKRTSQLADLVTNPELMQSRLAKNLDTVTQVAPKISSHVMRTAIRATQFLHAKAPKKEVIPGVVATQVQGLGPSSLELAKFERYVDAVEDPIGVVEGVEDGTISDEGAEALKVVYPEIYNQVVERLVQSYDKIQLLPYEQRLNLSILFDQPFDYTMQPALVSAVQMSYGVSQEPDDEREQVAMVRPTAGALKELSFAEKAKTQTERILSE